jgi:hypothetical protein
MVEDAKGGPSKLLLSFLFIFPQYNFAILALKRLTAGGRTPRTVSIQLLRPKSAMYPVPLCGYATGMHYCTTMIAKDKSVQASELRGVTTTGVT